MTVFLSTNTERFWGTSLDVKPTGVSPFSFFNESDTGKIYVCTNGTDWVEFPLSLSDRSILDIQ